MGSRARERVLMPTWCAFSDLDLGGRQTGGHAGYLSLWQRMIATATTPIGEGRRARRH